MSSIYVRGFEFGTDEDALRKHFSGIGPIDDVYFQGRGDAVITYADPGAAKKAVYELERSYLDGQTRYVDVLEGEGKGKGKGKGKGFKGSKGGGGAPGRTIFVSGFDFETDDDALTQHFGKIGAIDDFHFQSKSSAVITYVNESAAAQAVSELDHSTMRGQNRYVDVKMDGADRGGGGYKGSSKGGGKGGKSWGDFSREGSGRSIYVNGFDFGTDSAALEEHFGGVGSIDALRFQGSGGAVITYTSADAAQRAVDELANTTMRGQSRYCAVKLDEEKGSRKGGGKGKDW